MSCVIGGFAGVKLQNSSHTFSESRRQRGEESGLCLVSSRVEKPQNHILLSKRGESELTEFDTGKIN